MYKLQNTVQHYDWGCPKSLSEHFAIKNPQNKPMAELWMGAHPSASSKILVDGQWCSLLEEINANPDHYIGDKLFNRYNGLPFLFKVLASAQPLSIQVHPDLHTAREGFNRENELNIPMSSPFRNYKDANHKPELIYALTPFSAMNGFRPLAEIAALLSQIDSGLESVKHFVLSPSEDLLGVIFNELLMLSGSEKCREIENLNNSILKLHGSPWNEIKAIAEFWKEDAGLFMPLLLNVIHLEPGQAMFLDSCTPHAYLKGLGLEVMANSDNVLRAGLTNKHIDVDELIKNVNFISQEKSELVAKFTGNDVERKYFIPVEDFSFSIINVEKEFRYDNKGFPSIILCTEGELLVESSSVSINIERGDSLFIPAASDCLFVTGKGNLAIASVEKNTLL